MGDNTPVSNANVNGTPDSSNQYEGVSNPPDGGAVASVDTPADQMQTPVPAQDQAAQQPATPQAQPAQPQAQPQGQQQGQQQATPDLSKPQGAPGQTAAPAQQPNFANHPAVQKAGLLHTIAETLAGGPRYRDSIDPNTGEMQRQQVPMSGRDIGMAIVMEALGGALSGLSQSGPNADAKAASVGYQQGVQQQREIQQKQEQQASADFARHYQVLQTNMRLYQNAMTLGRLDFETNQNYVSQFKPVYDQLMKNHPEVFKGVVDESDLAKYHVTKDSAMPIAVVKRLDPTTGKQAVDKFGKPMWDIQYAIVDPNFSADNLLSDEDKKALATMGEAGFADGNGKPTNLPQSIPMKLSMYLGLKSKATAFELAQKDLNDYSEAMSKAVEDGNVPMAMPTMKNPTLQAMIDNAATKYNVPKAIARAVANQEGADPNGVSSKGAIGVMQLMPNTAAELGVTDPRNPQANIDGGVRYLSQLLNQYHGNVKLALAAYNAGPGKVTDGVPNIPETQNYVDSILKAVGMDGSQAIQAGDKDAFKPVNLTDAVRKDPALVNALEAFQPLLNATGHNYEKAIGELGAKDPQAAGKILQLYGGNGAVHAFDQTQALNARKVQAEQDEDIKIDQSNREAANKNALDTQASSVMQSYLKAPDNFQVDPTITDQSMVQAKETLQKQGVAIPTNFASLWGMAHYRVAPSSFSARVWAKGSPYEMDSQTANSYILQFLNPQYDQKNYASGQKMRTQAVDANSKLGSAILNSGTAANHLLMLKQAVPALHNGNIVALNRMANMLGVETGKSAPIVFDAIADKVTQEVERVAAGGTAPYKEELERTHKALYNARSDAQIDGVIRGYLGLMAGRLDAIDDDYYSTLQEHLPNVSNAATQLFQEYGFNTPWATQMAQSNPQGGQQGNAQKPPQVGDVVPYKGQMVKILAIDSRTGQVTAKPLAHMDQRFTSTLQ